MGCNYTDKIQCPKCGEDFGIQVETDGNQLDDLTARVTPLDNVECPTCRGTGKMRYPHFPESCLICRGTGRMKQERQQSLEEWLNDKLIVLKQSGIADDTVTFGQAHRMRMIEEFLTEYREKKAKGWLRGQ